MTQPIVQKAVNSLGYNFAKVSKVIRKPIDNYPFIDLLDLVIEDYIRQNQDVFLIQIGANDGNDNIRRLVQKYHWQGVLVEPQPHVFKRLVDNYAGEPQLSFENSAIAQRDGTITLYTFRDDDIPLPSWFHESASFERQRLVSFLNYWRRVDKALNLPKDADRVIKATSLPALSVTTLLKKYGIAKVDLLVIDTVGFDFEIIKMFPFDVIKPGIIHFEHSLLSLSDQEACFKYLAALGYSFAQVMVDTIAYRHKETRHGRYLTWPKL